MRQRTKQAKPSEREGRASPPVQVNRLTRMSFSDQCLHPVQLTTSNSNINLPSERSQQGPNDCRTIPVEPIGSNGSPVGLNHQIEPRKGAGHVTPSDPILLEYVPRRQEVVPEPREALGEQRQQRGSNPTPQVSRLLVAGIVPGGDMPFRQQGRQFGTRGSEQRPNPGASHLRHAGESERAGPLEEPHQHRLELIVLVMGRQNRSAGLRRHLFEPSAPSGSGSRLGRGGAELPRAGLKGEPRFLGVSSDPLGDPATIRVDPVIEMGHVRNQAERCRDHRGEFHQRKRIGAAGHRQHHRPVGHPEPLERGGEPGRERGHPSNGSMWTSTSRTAVTRARMADFTFPLTM